MNKLFFINTITLSLMLTACDKPQTAEQQSKQEIKQVAQVQVPAEVKPKQEEVALAAPSMSYEALYVSESGVGYDDLFVLQDIPDSISKALIYQTRAGQHNIMEEVVEDPEAIGYVDLERAYKFGNKYVLVVSTGESGNSCPATTYAFSYDIKSESVIGKTEIDGCSEVVEAFADGNKLTVKKDEKPTIIYNGEVK